MRIASTAADRAKERPAVTHLTRPLRSDGTALGASYQGEGVCSFRVWAPAAKRVTVGFLQPSKREVPLERDGEYFAGLIEGTFPGTRYRLRLDDSDPLPDPASRFQPEGLSGPSEVVATDFNWTDTGWSGVPLRDCIIYELHVGTFTKEGTFDAVIPRLTGLRDLGVTAIEIMPVAQFPGHRNWGYDGVLPYAVQNTYGGPSGLKRLVDACHRQQLAVILDVVYNHLGPEGNFLREFGPYFTDAYRTPWGEALNFDGPQSDGVRRYFLENALCWQTEFHIDALRLDAVHAIRDFSAKPFLQELAESTRARAERLNRPFHLIAESDLNDARLLRSPKSGGLGMAAQWSDDFHHSLHVLLTGERGGYYEDFSGTGQLARIFSQGWAYAGEYSRHRKRRHGNVPHDTSSQQFVVYSQNHDQVGNRFLGERLSALVSFEKLKLAAGGVLLSPFVPMLFMGEEYGEPAPFQYFISHSDPELVEAVRKGRRQEFAAFKFKGRVPDPFALETFQRCVLDHTLPARDEKHGTLRRFYRTLIRLRKELLLSAGTEDIERQAHALGESGLLARYFTGQNSVCLVMHFGEAPETFTAGLEWPHWNKLFDSAATEWNGPGSNTMRSGPEAGTTIFEMRPASFVVLKAGPAPPGISRT